MSGLSAQTITKTIDLTPGQEKAIRVFSEKKILYFEQNEANQDNDAIPFYSEGMDIPGNSTAVLESVKPFYSKKSINTPYITGNRNSTPDIKILTGRNNNKISIKFLPGQWTNLQNFQLLDSLQLTFRVLEKLTERTNPPKFASNSILRDIPTYKISTSQAGIYKVDNNFLSSLGVNTSNINPAQIRMFGTQAGPLPEMNNLPRTDDLQEMAIQVIGGEDGKWDAGDYILFYAPEVHNWKKTADSTWTRTTNIYEDRKYFFLQFNVASGKRVNNKDQLQNFDIEVDKYSYISRYEVDKNNLLRDFSKTGAGQTWVDEIILTSNRTKNMSSAFNLDNLIPGDTGTVNFGFASRSKLNSIFNLITDGQTSTMNMGSTQIANGDAKVAAYNIKSSKFRQAGGKWNVSYDFPQVAAESSGWLDYIEVNASRALVKSTTSLDFRINRPASTGNIKYNISGLKGDEQIWDITNMLSPGQYNINISAGRTSLIAPFTTSNQFVCFSNADLKTPDEVGLVPSQDIHGMITPDMVIVYHSKFAEEARQYATYRSTTSNMIVHAIDVEQIKNEFSGGGQDPTGIRDMARMFYFRDQTKFKYILMFGDGSYDYKGITFNGTSNKANSNYVPVYEYPRSIYHPIYAIPSDDYFGFMDDEEGMIETGLIDVFVGRFPIQDKSQAQSILLKISAYEKDKTSFGEWRNNIQLIADDWDEPLSDSFINQSELLYTRIKRSHPELNFSKIFLDIYKQESTVGGESYPNAVTDMNDQFNSGVLISNYIGHGGVDGLAQEKIIDRITLNGMKNKNRLPMLITGTCSFSTYDDPDITSVGKLCMTKPNGGMIALMTTSRSVFISANETFINKLFQVVYTRENFKNLTNGEILARAKNSTSGSDRLAFVLLGDPSMTLAFPQEDVVLESMNGKSISDINNLDTIKALEKIKLSGSVRHKDGSLISDFNGTLTLTVFDKDYNLYSKGNDGNGANIPVRFQNNIIFKGKASVTNGLWNIEFYSPKDINYAVDSGKLSFYAENGIIDAGGYNTKIKIGGESRNPIVDNTPPVIQLFMNDLNFVTGATVNTTPILIAKLNDDYGINISSSSIGHEIVSTINNDPTKEKIMNDFYSSSKDDYKTGEVNYKFDQLQPGSYKLKLRAWDIANNKSEAEIDFIVSNSEQNVISNLLNYPNPFTSATSFMFEFDSQNNTVEAQVAIYSVSGKLIKTISEPLSPNGKRFKTSVWNGLDDYGDRLGKGVYIYKVKVINTLDSNKKVITSDFQKLVLLK